MWDYFGILCTSIGAGCSCVSLLQQRIHLRGDKGTIPLSGTGLFLPSIAGYQHAWIVGLCLVFVPTRNVIGNNADNHQHRLGDRVVDVIAAETGRVEQRR
jgi:hypothetical protein